MSAKKSFNGRIMSATEIRRTVRQIKDMERELNGGISVPTNRGIKENQNPRTLNRFARFMDPDVHGDKARLKRDIERMKRNLQTYSPRAVTRTERNRLEKQAKADREWLQKHMTGRKLFHTRSNSPEFGTAVRACQREHDPRFKAVAERYKNTMRTISPDDESAASIESIRPD